MEALAMMFRVLPWTFILVCLNCACSSSSNEEKTVGLLKEYQWKKLNFKAAGWKHEDIYFISQDTGWVVVNNQGEIHKTKDGGKKWIKQFKPPERPFFRCIGFIDANLGFACNLTARDNDNPLYRTFDGGLTWSVVEMDRRIEGLCGISIVNAKTIFAAGKYTGPAHVVKSIDGGKTWSVTDMNHLLGQATDIHFFNDLEGVLIGGSSSVSPESRVVVLLTADGGENWIERYRGPRDGEMGWKVSFPSRDVGYVSIDTEGLEKVETEYFLKTDDGGYTWRRKPFYRGRYRAQGIGFVTEKIGWIGSFKEDRPSMVTTDGGENWRETEFGSRVNRFRFIDDKIGFAAGHWLYRFDKNETLQTTDR